MALPANFYRDPAEVLERKQEQEARAKARAEGKGCDGCAFRAVAWGLAYCTENRTPPGASKMKRCGKYTTTKGSQ